MLNALVRLSLARRGVVIALALLVLAWGGWTAAHAKLDVFPEFAAPQVVVQTECPGFSAAQVEGLVTRPVEAALAGSTSLAALRSQSIQGLSVITCVFADGTDPYLARQLLAEQAAEVETHLPDGVHVPRLSPLTSSTMDLLKIGLTSDTLGQRELRTLAQWTLRPRLLAVPGVATVSTFGGDVERIEIQVLPERLEALALTFDDVVRAAREATGVRGTGFVENDAQRLVVEARGQFSTPEELGSIVLERRAGRSLLLSDVARIVRTGEPKFGDALIQGRPGVLLTMLSQYGANTLDTTRALEAALREMEPALTAQNVTLWPRLHRPASFIENSLEDIASSLRLGAVLVGLVLFLFLWNVRTALISLLAIPLSLAVAVLVLHAAGGTLNTITLGGLAIALGEVVDDAIIDVENILRRLRENAGAAVPRRAFDVVLDASIEVRGAVVHATFVVVLVFLPVLTLQGLEGRLFAPLGVAYVLAILASLAVALTVTPALCLVLLPALARTREPMLLARLRAGYRAVLRPLATHAVALTALVFVACGAALWFARDLGLEFLPAFREGHFVLHVTTAPGTSLVEMKRVGARLSAALLAIDGVATVEQQIGRAELGEDPWGPNRSELHVELRPLPPAAEERVEHEIRTVLASFPGLRTDVLTFLGDRIEETISGETAEVVVSVYGEDLDALDAVAKEIAGVLTSVPGAVDVQPGAGAGSPSFAVDLDATRLAQFGLRPGAVLDVLHTALQGEAVARVWSAGRVEDVAVVLEPDARREPEQIGALRLRTPDGASVALSSLAALHAESGRTMLLHEGGRRRQIVTCNVVGRDAASFAEEARTRLAAVTLPTASYLSIGGAFDQEVSARRQLLARAGVALFGIVLLLATIFAHPRNLVLVLMNLPFALVGGCIAVAWAGQALSVGSLIGFVTLVGITLRNSIMMISHYEHLVSVEGATWNLETARRGASERLMPIVMTATVTALGLLPLAVQGAAAGREIESPMALVILGGLASSTVLNLVVLPALALRFGRFSAANRA